MQRHGIGRQLQRAASRSTPHDRAAISQIHPSRSLALDRPRQSAPGYPPAVADRPTTCRARRYPPRIRQRLHRRTVRCIGSISINESARGAQIPIALCRTVLRPLSAVSSLGGFRTPAPMCAAPPSWGRHPKPFTKPDIRLRTIHVRSSLPRKRTSSVESVRSALCAKRQVKQFGFHLLGA